MRVFIYEYTCSLGAGPESLRTEGLAMLAALMEDFTKAAGIEAVTLLDETSSAHLPTHFSRRIHRGQEKPAFLELARWADFSLIVAPEFDRLLETRCSWVLEAGGRLMGPSPEAVRLAADKVELGRRWHERGIPTPVPFLPGKEDRPLSFPLVVKPRHGAGSMGIYVVRTSGDLPLCLARAQQDSPNDDLLLQEFAPGRPVSVAFLIGPKQRIPLVPAEQHLSDDGRCRYRGGQLPLAADLARRAVYLASRAVDAVPGLSGYVGVDLVLGDAPDGRQDMAIEINPRPTTSYVGLRALAQFNMAETMLALVRGESLGDLRWKAGPISFQADGQLVYP